MPRWRKEWRSFVRRPAGLPVRAAPAAPIAHALLLVCLAFVLSGPARAAAPPSRTGVLVVLANYLTLDDLLWDISFREALGSASMGLVCPAAARGRSPEALHASCAAGAPCAGSSAYTLAFNATEPFEGGTAAEAYARRTGQPWVEQGIVHCGMAAVLAAQRRMAAPPDPWALGDALRRAGVPRFAFGNADLEGEPLRFGAALLTDAFGLVPAGDVGSSTAKPEPGSAGGRTTDFARLTGRVLEALDAGAVVVLEAGDLARIERERGLMSERAYDRARKSAVARLARWLDAIRAAEPRASVILLSIVPPAADDGLRDSPGLAVLWTPDGRPALLQSNTTRTAGLLTTLDVGPSILELASTPRPDAMGGFAATRSLEPDPAKRLRRWTDTIRLNERCQTPVLVGLGLVAALAAAVSVLFLSGGRKAARIGSLAVASLAVAAWIPPALLVPLDRPAVFLLIAPAILTGFIVAERFRAGGRFLPLELPTIVLLTGVALSAMGAAELVKRSPLSAWQMSGLRYYGIGNEFLGCVIAAAVLIPLWRLADAPVKPFRTHLAVWFTFWTLVIGLPFLGANSGGVVAAVTAFGLAYRALNGKPVRLRDAAALFLAGMCLVFGLAVFDALAFRDAPSHMGQAVQSLLEGEPGQIAALLQRKMTMNLTLWVRPETRVPLLLFGAVAVLLAVNRRRLASSVRIPGRLGQGLLGLAYGGLVAAFVNDSGAVTLAFIASYALGWWLWDAVTARTGGLPVMRISDARPRG